MKSVARMGRIIAILAFLFCAVAHAASGDADAQFGTGGITIVNFTPVAGAPGLTAAAFTDIDAQGRTWAAAEVVGSTVGLGLARLTRGGQLDTSFGSGGMLYVPITSFSALLGFRLAADGTPYVAYTTGNGAYTVWRVCRLTANGGFDSSFFGGCAGAAPAHAAVAHDLQISPQGVAWLLGTALDPDSNLSEPVVAVFDAANDVVRTATFPIAHVSIDAIAGKFNNVGTLFFTGSYNIDSTNNPDVVLGFIVDVGDQFTYELENTVGFDLGGSNADVGRCLAVTPDSKVVVGASVDGGYNGVDWATLQFDGNNLDSSYGTGGKSYYLIGDPELNRSNTNYAITSCVLGRDGALNMAGSYYFTDPAFNAGTTAVTGFRMLASGVRDMDFGGGLASPGIAYALEYPGAILDYYRPISEPRPRYDTATSISNVPNTGSVIVGGVSRRTDGSGYGDLAVMRVLTDDIFNSGFGNNGAN